MKTSSSHSSMIIASRISSNDHEQSKQSFNAGSEPEWQKNTIRVCGNWSEQLSSKGKVYFYNCITEVSQWQKPLEWKLPDMAQSEIRKIVCDRQRAQSVKRSHSSFNQIDKVKSRLQDGSSSPKRLRHSGTENNADLIKVEENSHTCLVQLNSSRKTELSDYESTQKTLPMYENSFESVPHSSSPSLAVCGVNARVNNVSCDEKDGFREAQISNRLSTNSDKILQSAQLDASGRLPSDSPMNHMTILPRLAGIFTPHSIRSPLLMTASSGQIINSDPQSSTSRSSSPFLSHNEIMHTPHHRPANACQRRFHQNLSVLNNRLSLSSDPRFRDLCPSKSNRRSQSDKLPTSPNRTSSIKPDQVLRNLVSVLSHAVDKQGRLAIDNASSVSYRTPPLNSAPRSQPLVANLLSTFLETHKTMADGRTTSQASPASNKILLNDPDKARNEQTSVCLSSSNGASIVSPSNFRNRPQNCHSPSKSQTVFDDLQHRLPSHSGENGSTVNSPSIGASECRHCPVSLETQEMLRFVDSHLLARFQHTVADTLETEAQSSLRDFDRLHSVLFSELSVELKKLRALVCISETKLKIHQQRKESLQELMDAIESKKTPSIISSTDAST